MANIIDPTRPEQKELEPVEIPGFGRLEDSRLKHNKVRHPRFPYLIRTYCSVCGKEHGYVAEESYAYIEAQEVIVICNDCDELIRQKLGAVPLKVAATNEATSIPGKPVCYHPGCTRPEEDAMHNVTVNPDAHMFIAKP